MEGRVFVSAQFLVLMVSTQFLQQEEPILGADRALCTSAWEVLYTVAVLPVPPQALESLVLF